MLEKIKQILKKDGWYVVQKENNIIFYRNDKNGNQNPYETYMCDSNNMYKFYKGEMSPFASLGNLENNVIGIYCVINNDRILISDQISDDVKKIKNCNTVDEIKKIFSKYFDDKYLSSNMNFDNTFEMNDAFNLSVDGKWLAVNFVLGDYYIPITEVDRQNELYAKLFRFLLLKNKFSSNIVPLINSDTIDERIILELFSLYSEGTLTFAKEKKNKVK